MPKQKTIYICQSCAYESPRWLGQCPECGQWNTLVETLPVTGKTYFAKSVQGTKAIQLSKVAKADIKRFTSGIGEFDRVLGGGFTPGQVVLLAGDPGIGKSTLLTQIAQKMENKKILYACGEESPQQIKFRTERMKYSAENLYMLQDTDVDTIFASVENSKDISLIIVDSIQALTSTEFAGVAGSVGQVKGAAQKLAQIAKRLSIPLIIVGHVTKEGTVAGPKVLEHLVDTVLYLEGDSQHMYRILKTTKNRFGPVSEVGIFEMEETGMREVNNPSKMFLSQRLGKVSGSITTVVMEGYRPILFEIQALTVKTNFGYPKRTASGFNANRLQVLIAILEKRCGISLFEQDIYLNVAGGFKVAEYACDLAVCLAIASAVKDKPILEKVAAFGECGLLGEIRKVSYEEKRLNEAKKLGFNDIINPSRVSTLREALKIVLPA